MSRIELQIVAVGNFANVQSEIAKLNSQVIALNKNFSGIGINPTDISRIKQYTKEFDSALRSTGAFTAKQVQLQSETEKFGKSLEAGHLKLRQYFQIINQGAKQSQGSLRNLALEQTKLQNSIIVKDPLKGGLATVYTPNIINEAANAAKIATNQQRLYNMAIDRGATSLINWGKNTQWAGRQLTVGLTVPLTMFGNAASKVFQQMDQELTRMQKVYGTGLVQPSQAALSAIRKDVSSLASELAKAWGTPIKETAAMAADLAATGKTGLDLVNATREALRLATLGELDKQQAMQATVSLQNVYKLNTQQLSEAVNFLNAVENQTSTSLQDLVDAIPRVGPIVAQMGGSFKDTAAMMVAMKEAGVPAAQSANAIKSALASMINPTKAAKEAFKAYGIDVAAIAGNNKGNPVKMLVDLQQKMKDLAPLAKEQLIEKMFGKFQMSRITALLDNLNKAGSQSRTVFQLMQASSQQLGAMAEQELKIQTESTTGKYKRAVESLKADLLPIGEQFTKVITKIINFGDSVVKMLDKLGPMKNLLGFVLGFVAVAGPLIMLTGVFGNLFGYIMKGISLFRNMRTEGAGLKGITGLLTAENIAASQATELMSQRMLEEVDSTKLLASAIDQLNLKLESMVTLMSKASQGGVGVATAQAEAMAVASTTKIKRSTRLPLKFATGGSVPGTGNYDTQPAMLTPGEFVVNKKAAQEHKALLHQINGGAGALGGIVTHGITHYGSGPYSAVRAIDEQTKEMTWNTIDQEIKSATTVATKILQDAGKTTEEIEAKLKQLGTKQAGHLEKTDKTSSNSFDANTIAPELGIPNQYVESLRKNYSRKDESKRIIDNYYNGLSEQAKLNTNLLPALERFKLGLPPLNRAQAEILKDLAEFDKNTKLASRSAKVRASAYQPAAVSAIMEERLSPKGDYYSRHISSSGQGISYDRSLDEKVRTQVRAKLDRLDKTIAQGVNQATKSASPSQEGIRIGKNLGDGLVIGASDKSIITQAQTGGRKVGSALLLNIESQMSRNPQFMIAGGNSELIPVGGMEKDPATGAKKKISLKGKMGGGMGLMAASMAMNSVGDKIPGGSLATGAMTGASLGMMLGPEGAAIGALAGLAISGISALIEKEKLHQATIKAVYSQATDLTDIFGTSLKQSGIEAYNASLSVASIGDSAKTSASDVQTLADKLSKLPKDSATKLVTEQIKNLDSIKSITGVLRTFMSGQVAAGIIPLDQVEVSIRAIMANAGKAGQAQFVYESLKKSLTDVKTATVTYYDELSKGNLGLQKSQKDINKLGEGVNTITDAYAAAYSAKASLDNLTQSYENLTTQGKAAADAELTLLGNLMNKEQIWTDLKIQVDAFNTSTLNSAQAQDLLAIAIKKLDNPDLLKIYTEVENGLKGIQHTAADTMLVLSLMPEALSGALKLPGVPVPGSQGSLTERIFNWIKSGGDPSTLYGKGKKPGGTGSDTDGNTGTDLTPLDKLIAKLEASKQALQDQKDALDKSIQKQKDYNDQLKKTQDYLTSTTDLENQIRVARAKGDYLQVGLLKQQLASKQTEFTSAATISPAEQQSQNLADRIAELTKQIQEANSQNKVIKKEIKAANKASGGYIPGYAKGSFGGVFGPGTSTSDSIPAYLSNGEYVLSANAVRNIPGNIRTLDKINGGDISSFSNSAVNNYSISVNVAGTNANPDQIAQAVLNTIQRRSNMNNTTRVI